MHRGERAAPMLRGFESCDGNGDLFAEGATGDRRRGDIGDATWLFSTRESENMWGGLMGTWEVATEEGREGDLKN